MENKALSVKEAAEYLGIHYSTFWRMQKQGKGPVGFLVGTGTKNRMQRFTIESLDIWRKKQEAVSA